jgi:TolA-binding protein
MISFRHNMAALACRVLIASGLIATLTAPRCPASELTESDHLQFANGLYARGMDEMAIGEYRRFLQAFPQSKQADVARFRMGRSHARLGRAREAEAEFAVVFRQFPQSAFRARAGYSLAQAQRAGGRHLQAAKTLQDLIDLPPPPDLEATAWYALADSLMELENLQAALNTFERVRRSYPDSPVYSLTLLRLANLYAAGEFFDLAKADKLYAALIAKPPSDRLAAEALFQRAGMHYRQKTYTLAADSYRTLLQRHPQDTRAREARIYAAWSAHHAGLHAEALKLAAAPHGERADEWLYLKANSERSLLQYAEAVRSYGQLLENHPASPYAPAARFESALASYRAGHYADAIAMGGSVKVAPAIARDLYWLLAESHAALKQGNEAVQYYRLLLDRFPDSPVAADAAYRLALHLQERGHRKEAVRFFRMVAEKWPRKPFAPNALLASAECQAEDRQPEEALRDLVALLKAYPQHALAESALYRKALHEIRLKRDAAALATLATLLERYPQTKFLAEASYWQGRILKQENKSKEAEARFRQVLAAKPADALQREAVFHLALLLLADPQRHVEAANLMQPLVGGRGATSLTLDHLRWLAEFRFERQDFQDSLSAAQALAQSAPPGGMRQIGWTLVGRAQIALDQSAKARAAFARALQEKAQTAFLTEAAWRLGELALTARQYKEAARHFTLAAESAEETDLGRSLRARSYAGLGRTAQAENRLEDAARFFMSVAILYDDPELTPECLHQAALLFEKLEQPERARQAARELAERFPESPQAKSRSARS